MFSIHLSELEHTGGATVLRAAHGKTPSISRHETFEVLRAYFASTRSRDVTTAAVAIRNELSAVEWEAVEEQLHGADGKTYRGVLQCIRRAA